MSGLPVANGDTYTTGSRLAGSSTQSCYEGRVRGGASRPATAGAGTQPKVLATTGASP